MTISYKWLSEYLPVMIEPERLARILTSIGLEVESFEKYEEIKGGLKGLVIGEVVSTEKHPNADKLTLTKVNVGNGEPLQIVCGAPNVEAGQKVVVAKVGTTIYPLNNAPLTMKVAKIRNVESHGMICAEDEIGLGTSHAGIIVLAGDTKIGLDAAEYFQPYEDWIYELDITNFIQHETGQPLHAFDADEIRGKKIIVKNLAEGTKFTTLDEKERKLSMEDLMICDAEGGICIAGVFGGIHSGVSDKTKNIFLESAWFNPIDIRKTSFRHDLRTDAATRFEKNIDISNTVTVLKRATLMIKE